jgi:hypothetical protein
MGSGEEDTGGGGGAVRGAVLKALVVGGGVLLLRRLRRSTTRWDHARAVADALSGEKVTPPPSLEKCLVPGAFRCGRIKNSSEKFRPFSCAATRKILMRGVFFLNVDRGKKCLCLNAFPDVQFSREQARKDPDNFFNLRSEFILTKALYSFFFVRISVSTAHLIRLFVLGLVWYSGGTYDL